MVAKGLVTKGLLTDFAEKQQGRKQSDEKRISSRNLFAAAHDADARKRKKETAKHADKSRKEGNWLPTQPKKEQ